MPRLIPVEYDPFGYAEGLARFMRPPAQQPRTLTQDDLGRRSAHAENLLTVARIAAPELTGYLTEPAPPPSYEPNAAGKIPPIGYHPNAAGAEAEILSNLATAYIPGGGAAAKTALAMAPLIPKTGKVVAGKAAGKAAEKGARALVPVDHDPFRTPNLPMDQASRHARAVEQGYTPGFWRGEVTGAAPDSYPTGGWFSLDREVAAGHAKRGGVQERPFWLQLDDVLQDTAPVTAAKYGRIVAAAREVNPKLAVDLAEQVAPGKGVDWVIGFGKAVPEFEIPIAPALVRHVAERGGAHDTDILSRAGFKGAATARDVHMFGGKGIRHDEAAFDPAAIKRIGIMFGVGGVAAGPVLDQASQAGSMSGMKNSR